MNEQAPYLRLLLILGSTWLVLTALALLPSAGPSFGRSHSSSSVRYNPSFSLIRRAQLAPKTVTLNEVARTKTSDPPKQRILLFGDSMVPVLMPRLADYCLENGHELIPVVWWGSTIIYWGWEDKLDRLLVEFNPSLVIVSLGTSELNVREVGECEPFIRMIVRKVGKRKLAWIGPPNWRADTGVNSLVESVLGPRKFFRSGDLELERSPDGIHPTTNAGIVWVDAFVGWLSQESDAELTLAWPTRTARPAIARAYPPRR